MIRSSVHAVLRLLATLAILSILATSCAPFGTSKRDRMLRFEADLNGNRDYVYQNFLEPETSDYVEIRDTNPGETWDTWFPPDYVYNVPYSITLDSFFGNPLEATVEGPSDFGGPKSMELFFARSGVYWYLEGLSLAGSKIVD